MKFLKPVTFYKGVFKDILMNKASKHGRLLGLDVSDKYVSLAVSDWKNLTAVPLRYDISYYIMFVLVFSISCNVNFFQHSRAFDMQEKNLSSMAADLFQSLVRLTNL